MSSVGLPRGARTEAQVLHLSRQVRARHFFIPVHIIYFVRTKYIFLPFSKCWLSFLVLGVVGLFSLSGSRGWSNAHRVHSSKKLKQIELQKIVFDLRWGEHFDLYFVCETGCMYEYRPAPTGTQLFLHSLVHHTDHIYVPALPVDQPSFEEIPLHLMPSHPIYLHCQQRFVRKRGKSNLHVVTHTHTLVTAELGCTLSSGSP